MDKCEHCNSLDVDVVDVCGEMVCEECEYYIDYENGEKSND